MHLLDLLLMVVEYSMVNQVAGHFNDRSELSQKVVENVKLSQKCLL